MKQYKDELLASCLTFVLSLHHNIIALDIKAYCPALEVGSLFFGSIFYSGLKKFEGLFRLISKFRSFTPIDLKITHKDTNLVFTLSNSINLFCDLISRGLR